jgi:hypothetical protein
MSATSTQSVKICFSEQLELHRHDIAEILLMLALSTHQSINRYYVMSYALFASKGFILFDFPGLYVQIKETLK